MSEEWGPWIEHDGGAQPVAGHVLVAVEFRRPPSKLAWCFGDPKCDRASVWDWRHEGEIDDIIRYRVRKPRALKQLRDMVENLPAPVRETEDAQ